MEVCPTLNTVVWIRIKWLFSEKVIMTLIYFGMFLERDINERELIVTMRE
jgi:hypothetical protein